MVTTGAAALSPDQTVPGALVRRRERVTILRVAVDRVGEAEAIRRVHDFLVVGGTHHVVTVNPEYVMVARRRPEFRAVLNGADLALADGVGIVWASRILGAPVPERTTGVDMVAHMAEVAAARDRGIFLLGAGPGVAERAGAMLAERVRAHGALRVATHAGSPSAAEAPEILARICEAEPAMLFVAFGSPAQDLWLAEHRHELGVPVMMGVGGAFDFLAGVQPRAPGAMRSAGLEWLWRLAHEPWRWRRQLALPRFALAVVRQRLTEGHV